MAERLNPTVNELLEAIREVGTGTQPPSPGFMTLPQIAEALGMSVSTTRRRLRTLQREDKVERFVGNAPHGGRQVWYRFRKNGKP